MFSGPAGSGKTALLRHCLSGVPPKVPRIALQLRAATAGVAEIFYRSGSYLGWECFPTFKKYVAELEGTPKVEIDHNWLAGINNRISVVLRAETITTREDRRAVLTDAWFDDLRKYAQLVLFAFDAYELAATEAQDWINGPFLARVVQSDQIRTLIAGQRVPDVNNIEWGHCCAAHHLFGVPEAAHWLPVLKAMNRIIPVDDPGSWLAGVCHALQGRPKDIIQILEGLPKGPSK